MEFPVFEIILSAIGGGTVTQLLSYKINKRKEDRADYKGVIEVLQQDNDRLRGELQALQTMFNDYRESTTSKMQNMGISLAVLQAHMTVLDQASFNDPHPMMTKTLQGEVLIVNKSFEVLFLRGKEQDAEDWIGKSDKDLMPSEIIEAQRNNEEWVIANRAKWEGMEKMVEDDGSVKEYRVLIIPRFSANTIIGLTRRFIPEL